MSKSTHNDGNKLEIFTIFDVKASAYITPFYLPTVAMATRTFTDCINSEQHQFGRHPSDYILFHAGSFNINTAKHTLFETLTPLGNGVDFINPNSPPKVPTLNSEHSEITE